MRRADELDAATHAQVAARLTNDLPEGAVVVDVGSGTGGMSAALATALARRGGGTLLLVDAVPELLSVAAENAAAPVGARQVEISTIHADVATEDLDKLVPPAHLIWAASMVHHLPDQQSGVTRFARALAREGMLALAEGGLETRCLPWDLGIGEPGLERRLLSARDDWFGELRAKIPSSVRMPYGWNVALNRAGLTGVGSFSALFDHPAPPTEDVRGFVVDRVAWLVEAMGDRITTDDLQVAHRLLDPADPGYLGHRDDLYLLGTQTVHFGLVR